jgi:hypothetical protein
MYLAQLSAELARLLGARFIPHEGKGGIVGIMLGNVIHYHNTGKQEFRDRELTKLSLLAGDLHQIESFSLELLQQFQRQYAEDTRAKYFGTRMEIATAALLIRRNVRFTKRESPDFRIPFGGQEISIECGSTHFAGGATEPDIKIAQAIESKVLLPYFDNRTVLFLDITNVLSNTLVTQRYLEQTRLEQIARNEMRDRQVGSTILFYYVLDKTLDRFEMATFRIDNQTIHPLLDAFLGQHLGGDERSMGHYDIPSEG